MTKTGTLNMAHTKSAKQHSVIESKRSDNF